MISRRSFVQSSIMACGSIMIDISTTGKDHVRTVLGTVDAGSLGYALIHEHILVDFIGAEKYDPGRWERKKVIEKVLPYLKELRSAGCKTMVDCTPNFLGRDVRLLEDLSILSSLNIITNTGYYGGSDNKFLPSHAFTETDHQLSARWIRENKEGIEGTGIKPGFIKISVNDGTLSDISKKLVRAAAYCHLQTGLSIASHTGPAIPAFEQFEILEQLGVNASAFIWVHAQNEQDKSQYISAAKKGCWLSLDGLREDNVKEYVNMLLYLKEKGYLDQTLVSHDAGWYEPGKPDGGTFRSYTTIFRKLIPAIKGAGFTEKEIARLLQINPANAFRIRVRKV